MASTKNFKSHESPAPYTHVSLVFDKIQNAWWTNGKCVFTQLEGRNQTNTFVSFSNAGLNEYIKKQSETFYNDLKRDAECNRIDVWRKGGNKSRRSRENWWEELTKPLSIHHWSWGIIRIKDAKIASGRLLAVDIVKIRSLEGKR
jgi:hypothetical protein